MQILKLKNLVYKSNNDVILNGINLQINKGECISIIGPSGSGKSTLLKAIADLIQLSEGSISYRNKSYEEHNPLELRKNISYCVQLPHLFGETVYDNLVFPFIVRKEKVNMDRINELLNKFNLSDDYLNKKVSNLSGGERQRVAMIRNLIYTPEILLLDEATSALDRENADNVEKIIRELNYSGVTVIWITHNIEQSKGVFRKRIKLEEGKIQEIENIDSIKCEVS